MNQITDIDSMCGYTNPILFYFYIKIRITHILFF